jgi:glutaminase
VVTLDGHEYSAGDSRVPFTIQSISKPFVYGLALEDYGEEYVLERVGLEPTGDAFNAISLDPKTGRPANAMINAGAIATAAMVQVNGVGALQRLINMFSRYAGHDVKVDEAVYRSESDTGHRNRAIGHLLRNFGIVSDGPDDALDLYFSRCSVSVTCRDLAVMAATLANKGVNPATGERAIESRYVSSVLSMMSSCGMYDYAGEWIYRVGMPAKSGVSGGVLAVLPGQLGIGIFSPLLDPRGNSVRGVKVCSALSDSYNLHLFNMPHTGQSGVRHSYDGASVRSKRERPPAAADLLAAQAHRIAVYELQGDQVFATMEALTRDIVATSESLDLLIVDFRRVAKVDSGATTLLADLVADASSAGLTVVVSGVSRLPEVMARIASAAPGAEGPAAFSTLDSALGWCEDQLLARLLPSPDDSDELVPPSANELCEGLTPADMQALESTLRTMRVPSGTRIVSTGETGESLYLLCRGQVSVVIEQLGNETTRVATLLPGMMFGEMVMLGEPVRAAAVIADSDVECAELSLADFHRLAESHPNLRGVIYENLARKLARGLRSANRQLSALSG